MRFKAAPLLSNTRRVDFEALITASRLLISSICCMPGCCTTANRSSHTNTSQLGSDVSCLSKCTSNETTRLLKSHCQAWLMKYSTLPTQLSGSNSTYRRSLRAVCGRTMTSITSREVWPGETCPAANSDSHRSETAQSTTLRDFSCCRCCWLSGRYGDVCACSVRCCS